MKSGSVKFALLVGMLALVVGVFESHAQSYKANCVSNAEVNYSQRGFVLGYALGLGGLEPLKCIDVSWKCRNKSLRDKYAEIANLTVTGPGGFKMTIIDIDVVGRDKDLIELRVRKNERPRERVKINLPIKLIRHAGTGSYPRFLELGAKCDKNAPNELSATLRIKYRLSHSTTKVYTKSYKLY